MSGTPGLLESLLGGNGEDDVGAPAPVKAVAWARVI